MMQSEMDHECMGGGCGHPSHMAEGGEMDGGDDEILDAVVGELMHAFKNNDKKGILDAIRAIVLSCGE
jgi:hypothetical protein